MGREEQKEQWEKMEWAKSPFPPDTYLNSGNRSFLSQENTVKNCKRIPSIKQKTHFFLKEKSFLLVSLYLKASKNDFTYTYFTLWEQ